VQPIGPRLAELGPRTGAALAGFALPPIVAGPCPSLLASACGPRGPEDGSPGSPVGGPKSGSLRAAIPLEYSAVTGPANRALNAPSPGARTGTVVCPEVSSSRV